jgi:GT2 family glycosyltransferase
MKTSIITPIWNRSDLTHQFMIHHHRNYKSRPEVEFVMVNNGSTDDTAIFLKYWQEQFTRFRFKVVDLESNLGFGPGNNRGVQAASGDLLIFLSNDVIPQGDYITLIQEAIQEKMIIGAEMFSHDTGWNRFKMADGEEIIIPYLAGWCLAMSRQVWDFLTRNEPGIFDASKPGELTTPGLTDFLTGVGPGAFDERFVPCDYEDLDLNYRAAQAGIGLNCMSLPLKHAFGQSAQQLDRMQVTLKNRQLFMEKWGLVEP